MRGIAGRTKRYVEVIADTSEEGVVTPLAIIWEGGRRYVVDQVLDRRPARSLKTGATGMRYTIRVGNTTTNLWYEGPRWFVEAKGTVLP